MSGGIDEIDEVGDTLLRLLTRLFIGDRRLVLVEERNGAGLHRNASFLLLFPICERLDAIQNQLSM